MILDKFNQRVNDLLFGYVLFKERLRYVTAHVKLSH